MSSAWPYATITAMTGRFIIAAGIGRCIRDADMTAAPGITTAGMQTMPAGITASRRGAPVTFKKAVAW
ncbi:MAG TPA: hypothetical protein PLB81_09350 [Deltaproteobacteria bacterium]|nr:hypothetical protein [Deltaproteobacteria bacterium]